MSIAARKTKLTLLCLLVVLLGGLIFLRASAPRGQALAYTSCTIHGPVLVMNAGQITAQDMLPVRMHENVHVSQCRELGWTKMRLRNLTAGGRLSLEAPAYCEGARARLRRGDHYGRTRERLFDDANAMFAGAFDSSRVNGALRAACPELTSTTGR